MGWEELSSLSPNRASNHWPSLQPTALTTRVMGPPHVLWRKSREHFNQRPEDSERLFRSRWGIFWINDSRCTSKDALHYHRNEHERGANGRVHWTHSYVCVQLSDSGGVGGTWMRVEERMRMNEGPVTDTDLLDLRPLAFRMKETYLFISRRNSEIV